MSHSRSFRIPDIQEVQARFEQWRQGRRKKGDSADNQCRWLAALIASLSAGVLFYSQQIVLDWDEGFHLVGASLINAGSRPYIDFCFPQPPLHAYWNALWLHLCGGGWRGPHAAAALLTCGAIALTADFIFRRAIFRRAAGPNLAGASVAALFVGLNKVVVEYGTKAQAYGAGMFLTVAAFRLAVGKPSLPRTVLAGCLAGAAAACTLLTAPACAVLLLWTAWQRRLSDAAAFLAGTVVGSLPVLLSLVRAPYPTWFNLVEYHIFFRQVGWDGATENDLHVLASSVDSGQPLLLGLFAVAGVLFIWNSNWISSRKAEFYLAGGIAAALAVEAAAAHPTFTQYFIFIVPFLAMLAAVGFCEAIERLSLRSGWALTALTVVLALSLANSLAVIAGNNHNWVNMEALARKIEQVTPSGAAVFADPPVYFALRRPVPPAMVFPSSHILEFPAAMAARLRIVPQSQLERQVRAGEFATAESCDTDEDDIQALQLPKLYSQSSTVADCVVYWGFRKN